jgi:two-component system, LytTR family, response regulator
MTIRVLVVDDEPLAREGVAFQLRNERDVEIVGECQDGSEAVRAIRTLKPDLVFLDLKMPKVDGFAVVEKIGADKMPLVIFLTAYDEHALEAFRLNALDYLLKPIDRVRFRQSVQRARERLAQNRTNEQGAQLDSLLAALANKTEAPVDMPSRIAVKLGGQIQFLRPEEVVWVEAEGDYVSVHTPERSHLVRETMQAMEQRLDPHGFQRIHRSAIINLDKVEKLVASENGDYEVRLSSGLALKVGRNYREALFRRMQING